MLLITESLEGTHLTRAPKGAELLSTKGSSVISYNYNNNSYYLSKAFRDFVESAKPEVVLIGTDLDQTGTKVATVIKSYLDERGIRNVRTAFTEKGYLKVGRFYTEEEMNRCKWLDKANIEIAKFFSRRGLDGGRVGRLSLSKAIVLGSVKKLKEKGRVRVRRGKTCTATALVKGNIYGLNERAVMQKLQRLYLTGKIEYPRVDADYFPSPYQVYAHPPLTSTGYEDEIISPIVDDELPVALATVPLALAEERITTPSTVEKHSRLVREVFDESLIPKPEYTKLVKECESIAREYEPEYKKALADISPNAPLFPYPKPRKRKELDDWYEKLMKKLKELEEEERKSKDCLFAQHSASVPELSR